MKVYIILSRIANCIGGAPIYHRNKAKYLEERGWQVFIFTENRGNVLIRGLEKYADYYFPCIANQPNSYTRKQREELLLQMTQHIDQKNCEEIIVETGTDYAAFWGEYLAKALNAKHFFFSLEENRDLDFTRFQQFYGFKFNRGELACIDCDLLNRFMGDVVPLQKVEKYELGACCANSVEAYDNDFSKSLTRYDYNIGSIGRLEKVFVPTIVQGIEAFAHNHPDKTVQAVFIGGTEQKRVCDDIERRLRRHANIKCIITGYMWPIPQSIFSKIDVFASGAGSVYVSLIQGVPTIDMDVVSGAPIGIVEWGEEPSISVKNNQNVQMEYLLEKVLIDKTITRIQTEWNPKDEWGFICQECDKHMNFLSESEKEYTYYNIDKLPLSAKRKLFKLLHCIFGISGIDKLHVFYRKLKRILGVEK